MDIIVHHDVVPMVNQIETHPFNQQIETHKFLHENGLKLLFVFVYSLPFRQNSLFMLHSLPEATVSLSRCTSRMGGTPKMPLYSRMK